MQLERAIVFLAWGETFIEEVVSCIQRSQSFLDYPYVLITDENTSVSESQLLFFNEIIRGKFETNGLLRKAEMIKFLPDKYEVFLFLDSDTTVIEDISLGFEKAERFQLAVSPAPHYSLDYFSTFREIMEKEKIAQKGQVQFNTGVIFFKNTPQICSLFELWMMLALKYRKQFTNDQPFFSLAMEIADFNPYMLSISYNYRAFGDPISGLVRIWHSRGKLPRSINKFKRPWPPRRAFPNKVIYPSKIKKYTRKIKKKLLLFTNSVG
jgi:hypothetical protein